MKGIEVRLLKSTGADMLADVELPNGQVLSVFDDEQILDGDPGEDYRIALFIEPGDLDINDDPDEEEGDLNIRTEGLESQISAFILGEVVDQDARDDWPITQRDEPIMEVETGMGPVTMQHKVSPDEEFDFETGKRLTARATSVNLLAAEEI